MDLTPEEIALSLDPREYPPILNPDQAARLLQIEKSTLYRWVSERRLKAAVRRGRPLRFWRDRLINEFMEARP